MRQTWIAVAATALLTVLGAAVSPAFGQARPHTRIGFYVEGFAGLALLSDGRSKCDAYLQTNSTFNPTCSIEDRVAELGGGGGVRFGRFFEAGGRFVNLGEVQIHEAASLGVLRGTVEGFFGPIRGVEVLGRAKLKFVYVEAGAWRWRAESGSALTVSLGSSTVQTEANSENEGAWSPVLGGGAHFPVGRDAAVRIGYEFIVVKAGLVPVGALDERFHVVRVGFVFLK